MLLPLTESLELSKLPSNAAKANASTKYKPSTTRPVGKDFTTPGTETILATEHQPPDANVVNPAQAPDKAVSNKRSSGGATPTKLTAKSSTGPVKQNAPVPVQGPSTSPSGNVLKIVASGGRMYRGLSKFRHASPGLVATLVPGWDIDDEQPGDEEIDHDDSDPDSESDSDNDDRRGDPHQNGSNNANKSHEGEHRTNDRTGKRVGAAGAAELAPTTPKTPGAQPNATAPNSKNATNENPYEEKDTITNEKEILDNDLESGASLEPIPSEMGAKSLKKRYKDWSQYIVWSIMISFPILFIGT
jgi:hypothetical protein